MTLVPLGEDPGGAGAWVVRAPDGRGFTVFAVDGGHRVTDATCPHNGGPLEQGWRRDGHVVVCPWHWYRFDLDTGECATTAALPAGDLPRRRAGRPAVGRRRRTTPGPVVVRATARARPHTAYPGRVSPSRTEGKNCGALSPPSVDEAVTLARPSRESITIGDADIAGGHMKFDMDAQTLSTLTKQTQGSTQDLGTLITQLINAVTPLENTFQGAGRAKFDAFKANADSITAELNSSLTAILGGQSGMGSAFQQGDMEMGDNAGTSASSADFDSARFGARH